MTSLNSRPVGGVCPSARARKSRGRAPRLLAALVGLGLSGGAAAQGIIIEDGRDPLGPIFYDQPLQEGSDQVRGRSIAEIIAHATPVASPIDGLPDAAWKDQPCTSCHNWDREALCTQGKFYLTPAGEPALTLRHPLGGDFKRSLKVWARDGCQ